MEAVVIVPTPDAIRATGDEVRNAMARGDYYAGIEALESLIATALLVPDLNALPRLVAAEVAAMGHDEYSIEEAVEAVLGRRAAA